MSIYAAERFLQEQDNRVLSAQQALVRPRGLERRDVNAVRNVMASLERSMQQASQAVATADARTGTEEQAPPPPTDGMVEGEFREI